MLWKGGAAGRSRVFAHVMALGDAERPRSKTPFIFTSPYPIENREVTSLEVLHPVKHMS